MERVIELHRASTKAEAIVPEIIGTPHTGDFIKYEIENDIQVGYDQKLSSYNNLNERLNEYVKKTKDYTLVERLSTQNLLELNVYLKIYNINDNDSYMYCNFKTISIKELLIGASSSYIYFHPNACNLLNEDKDK